VQEASVVVCRLLNEAVEYQRCCNDNAVSQQLMSLIVTTCIHCKLITLVHVTILTLSAAVDTPRMGLMRLYLADDVVKIAITWN